MTTTARKDGGRADDTSDGKHYCKKAFHASIPCCALRPPRSGCSHSAGAGFIRNCLHPCAVAAIYDPLRSPLPRRPGYRLAREPSDISVEDILRSIGSMEDDSLLNEVVLPAWLLRDLCFGNDLTYFFVAEWRAEDVHADVAGDSPQLGHVTRKKAPPLDILEEAFETAGGDRHREANTLGTIGPPGVRTELRQKNQITRSRNEGKIERPNDCLPLDQFKTSSSR